jgi:hypothetical protein
MKSGSLNLLEPSRPVQKLLYFYFFLLEKDHAFCTMDGTMEIMYLSKKGTRMGTREKFFCL